MGCKLSKTGSGQNLPTTIIDAE
jgi:WD40 repeat protein